MELSMWMLADALADDIIAAEISDGRCVLQGVRIDCGIASENIAVLSFDDSGRIVFTNGVDRLVFHASDIASIANRILEVFDFYRAWERKTLELIRGGYSSAELARRFGELLNLSLFLADTTFYSYARYFSPIDPQLESLSSDDHDRLPTLELMMAINSQPDIRTIGRGPYYVDIPGMESARTVARNLFLEGRHIGWVVVFSPHGPLSRGQMQLIDFLGELTEQYHRFNSSEVADLERTSMFADIIEGKPVEAAAVEKRLALWGWRGEDQKLVYVLRCDNDSAPALQDRAILTSSLREHTFRFYYNDLLLILVNLAQTQEELLDEALRPLAERGDVRIGKSRPFTDIFRLKEQLSAAQLAVDCSRPGTIGTLTDAALPYIFSLIRSSAPADLRHPELETLRAYDEKHRAGLLETLYVFLSNERSFTKTAETLYIHRSTLIYRLRRIAELTSLDLEDPDVRLHIMISSRLDSTRD